MDEPHSHDLMGLEKAFRQALEPLTDQQRIFVRAYLIDLNGAEAARQAGCSEKSAKVTASKWLTKVNLSRAIKLGMRLRELRLSVSADTVMSNLLAIRDQSMSASPVFDAKGKIVEGVWQYDSKGAVKAVELLGKQLGMFGNGKDGAISMEAHNKVTEQMAIEVVAAINGVVSDEAERASLIDEIDRRWSAISVETTKPGGKRTP